MTGFKKRGLPAKRAAQPAPDDKAEPLGPIGCTTGSVFRSIGNRRDDNACPGPVPSSVAAGAGFVELADRLEAINDSLVAHLNNLFGEEPGTDQCVSDAQRPTIPNLNYAHQVLETQVERLYALVTRLG